MANVQHNLLTVPKITIDFIQVHVLHWSVIWNMLMAVVLLLSVALRPPKMHYWLTPRQRVTSCYSCITWTDCNRPCWQWGCSDWHTVADHSLVLSDGLTADGVDVAALLGASLAAAAAACLPGSTLAGARLCPAVLVPPPYTTHFINVLLSLSSYLPCYMTWFENSVWKLLRCIQAACRVSSVPRTS